MESILNVLSIAAIVFGCIIILLFTVALICVIIILLFPAKEWHGDESETILELERDESLIEEAKLTEFKQSLEIYFLKSTIADLQKTIQDWKFACDVQSNIHKKERKEMQSIINSFSFAMGIAEDLTDELVFENATLEARLTHRKKPVKQPIIDPLNSNKEHE